MHFLEWCGFTIVRKLTVYGTMIMIDFRLALEISANIVYNYHRQAKASYLKFGDTGKVVMYRDHTQYERLI